MAVKDDIRDMEHQLDDQLARLMGNADEYSRKLGEWKQLKDRWEDLDIEVRNLSDKAHWRFNAAEKQMDENATKAVRDKIGQLRSEYSSRDIYAAVVSVMDRNGSSLFRAAETITGLNVDHHYFVEASMGKLENMNGFGRLELLEAAKFGGCTDMMSSYEIDTQSNAYRQYEAKLYDKALEGMASRPSCGLRGKLEALANLNKVGSYELGSGSPAISKEGWRNDFGIYYPDEEPSYEDLVKMDRKDICVFIDKPFNPPPEFKPIAIKPLDEPDGFRGLAERLMPSLRLQTLDGQIQSLLQQNDSITGSITVLDEMIGEKSREIEMMDNVTCDAKISIEKNEGFAEWMRKDMAPELSALGLDPATVTVKDLAQTVQQFISAQDLEPAEPLLEDDFMMDFD